MKVYQTSLNWVFSPKLLVNAVKVTTYFPMGDFRYSKTFLKMLKSMFNLNKEVWRPIKVNRILISWKIKVYYTKLNRFFSPKLPANTINLKLIKDAKILNAAWKFDDKKFLTQKRSTAGAGVLEPGGREGNCPPTFAKISPKFL